MPPCKKWFIQVRGPFLILSVALVLIGFAESVRMGKENGFYFLMALAGVTLAHSSVNLFNEISDYRTGIDGRTERTPFSGGSGLLQAGASSPAAVTAAAYGTLAAAACIGIAFLLIRGWKTALFIIPGGLAVRFYTSHLTRWLLGEAAAGLTLGSLVVVGTVYVITGQVTWSAVLLSVPPGLLTFLLLFLNEFPDMEADREGGRHHLVIHFGRKTSSRIYAAVLVLVYVFIGAGPFLSDLPRTLWIGFLTLPLGAFAARTVLVHHSDSGKRLPALAMNVGIVILTDLLLAFGCML